MRRGGKRERGREHFPVEAERPDRRDERDRAVREQRQLSNAKMRAQRSLEALVLSADVGELLRRPDRFEMADERRQRWQQRPGHINRRVERNRGSDRMAAQGWECVRVIDTEETESSEAICHRDTKTQ